MSNADQSLFFWRNGTIDSAHDFNLRDVVLRESPCDPLTIFCKHLTPTVSTTKIETGRFLRRSVRVWVDAVSTPSTTFFVYVEDGAERTEGEIVAVILERGLQT